MLTPDVFAWFLLYLFILMIIVGYMFARVHAIKFFIWMVSEAPLQQMDRCLWMCLEF